MVYNGHRRRYGPGAFYRGGALAACRGGRRLGVAAALKRIDEERLAAAKDDDDGEDPVLMTWRRPGDPFCETNPFGFVVFKILGRRNPFCRDFQLTARRRRSTRTLAARRPRGYNTYASIIAAQRRQPCIHRFGRAPVPSGQNRSAQTRSDDPHTLRRLRQAPRARRPIEMRGCQTRYCSDRCLRYHAAARRPATTSVRKSPTVAAPNNTTPTKNTRRPS